MIKHSKLLLSCFAVTGALAFAQPGPATSTSETIQLVPRPVPVLISQAEEARALILAETPAQEAAEQAAVSVLNGKPEYVWRVCDKELHAQFMMAQLKSPGAALRFDGKTVGEVCYSWLGTRKDWKATILQEGCNKRCSFY